MFRFVRQCLFAALRRIRRRSAELPYYNELDWHKDRLWTDAPQRRFQKILAKKAVDPLEERALLRFRTEGYAILPKVIPHEIIEAVLEHLQRSWRDRPDLLVQSPLLPITQIAEIPDEGEFRLQSCRYLDFHNTSTAAAEIACNSRVGDFLRLIFEEDSVLMQTLLFENGSQQGVHQDFPYVHTPKPPYLVGVWVALEDVREEAGPLFYYPKSHREVRKFAFEQENLLAVGPDPKVAEYEAYLAAECESLGLEKRIFLPAKGDALVWHSALAHGGMPRLSSSATRHSMVSHYSAESVYTRCRRSPHLDLQPLALNSVKYFPRFGKKHSEGLYGL